MKSEGEFHYKLNQRITGEIGARELYHMLTEDYVVNNIIAEQGVKLFGLSYSDLSTSIRDRFYTLPDREQSFIDSF